jgi:Spy/CpxP family protein refolding chaperone
MKRVWSITMVVTALLLMLAHQLLAQGPPVGPAHRCSPMMGEMKHGMGLCDIPDLSSEQISKIQKLKLGFQKEMLPLRTQLQTKRLELQTLIAENAEQKKLEAKIDEISKASAELMKKRIAHRQEIRKLLTDEQKAYFDLRGFGMGRKGGFGHDRMRGW